MATVTQPTQGSNIQGNQPLISQHVFATGVHKPEFSQYLSYCYPQYTVTSLLDRIGRFESVGQDTFEWAEVERTREVATVSVAGIVINPGPPVTATITCDETVIYFVAGDVVKLANDKLAYVTAAVIVGGFQTLTLETYDTGSPLVAGDFTAGDKLAHQYNINPEYSNEPDSRIYLPVAKSNKLNILRRTCEVSTTELSNVIWMNINGKPYWYYADEDIAMQEFARDREIAILNGQSPVGLTGGAFGGNGIIDFVNTGGVIGTYAGAVVETDLMDMIQALIVSSPASEFLVLAGSKFMRDATQSLRDYAIGGGVDYGAFGNANMAGLNFQSYMFMQKTIHFVHYQLFDDPKVFPINASGTDMSKFSLWLNMGADENGRSLISGKYKKDPNGVEYKFLRKITPGMSTPGVGGNMDGIAATGRDGFTVHLYSYLGVEVRCANQHGILKAA